MCNVDLMGELNFLKNVSLNINHTTKPQIHNEIYKEISKQKANKKSCKNLKDNLKIENVEL
jgi:hypothetical protein